MRNLKGANYYGWDSMARRLNRLLRHTGCVPRNPENGAFMKASSTKWYLVDEVCKHFDKVIGYRRRRWVRTTFTSTGIFRLMVLALEAEPNVSRYEIMTRRQRGDKNADFHIFAVRVAYGGSSGFPCHLLLPLATQEFLLEFQHGFHQTEARNVPSCLQSGIQPPKAYKKNRDDILFSAVPNDHRQAKGGQRYENKETQRQNYYRPSTFTTRR